MRMRKSGPINILGLGNFHGFHTLPVYVVGTVFLVCFLQKRVVTLVNWLQLP